jgi:hypothetical protein
MADADVTSGAQQILAGSAGLPGRGLAALGGGLRNIGEAAGNIAMRKAYDEQQTADKIALNDAKTTWLLNSSNLDQTLKQETDPNRINQEFPNAILQAAEASRQNLTEEQKAHFDEWLTPHMISLQKGVTERADGILREQGIARSKENIFRFQDIAKRQPTAEDAMKQLPNIAREIDNGVLKGYWGADDAVVRKNALTKDVAKDWVQSQDDETIIGVLGDWKHSLKMRESGGKPTRMNPFGFAGLYQFGAPRLTEIGVYTPGSGENLKTWNKSGQAAAGKWTGTFHVPGHPEVKTIQDFLSNPAAQEAAFGQHTAKMDEEIARNGLEKYIGQTVGGVQITKEGVYSMLHLGGVGGAKNALEGKGDARDANGTSVLEYARLGRAHDRRIADFIDPEQKKSILAGAEARRAHLIDQADAAMKEQIATQAAIEKVNTGLGLNPFDTDGKKDLDRAYSGIVSSGVDPSVALTHIVEKTKALPPDAVRGVRQGLASNNPSEVAETASNAFNLMSRGGNAVFAPYDGGDEIEKTATKYQHYTEYLGMSGEEAGKRLIMERDPAYKAKVKAQADTFGLDKNIRDDEKAGALLTDLEKKFGAPRFGGWLGTSGAQVAFREGDRQSMVEDYKQLIKDNFDTSGDYALARDMAASQLARVWGATEVAGKRVAMRYPPETAPVFKGIPDVAEHIGGQIQEEIKAATGQDIDRSKIILEPVEGGATSRAFWSGKNPPYRVSYIDKNGHYQTLNPGKAFVADIEKMHKAAEAKFRERQTMLEGSDLPESAAIQAGFGGS